MNDRTTQPSALPAEFAERVSDRSCFDADEIEAAPAPIPDDRIYRLAVIEVLDRMIRDRKAMVNPKAAWWLVDTAVLGVLNEVRECVVEMEGE